MGTLEFTDWEPHTVATEEFVDPVRVAGLAALFDDGLPAPGPGAPLPPLWHWVALPRWNPSGVLGSDGHPGRGGFLPPVDAPRRMFAGGRVEFLRPLRVGALSRCESTVTDVAAKTGRSGSLVIVDVTTVLHDEDGAPAVREVQNLVYRQAAAPVAAPPDPPTEVNAPGTPLVARDDGDWELRTDPSLLMRFSALTANAHRIHYDWPYATRVEGYPGLVVHGPLQGLVQAEAHRLAGGAAVRELSHRGSAPLFCGEPALLAYHRSATGASVTLTRDGARSPNSSVEIVTV